MTITLTPVTKKQIDDISKVALWVIASSAVSVAIAAAAHNSKLIDLMPVINIAAVTVGKFFQQEEDSAIAALPAAEQPKVSEIADKVSKEAVNKAEQVIIPDNPAQDTTVTTPAQ